MIATSNEPLREIRSTTLVLPEENIDTDQIIPARFLTTTERKGLGRSAFIDWRRDSEGRPREDCALNDERASGCAVLVAGHNFGCGSSREHAPWALHDLGLRAVISSQIADIFRANAAKNGIVPIVVTTEALEELKANAWGPIEVSVETCTVQIPGRAPIPFDLDAFTRRLLLEGIDPLCLLLSHAPAIQRFEATHTS